MGSVRGHDLFRIAVLFAAVLCYATILLGGNVMANNDGLGCPHWPTCYPNGNLLPAFQGPAAVEWSHRVFAFFLSISVLAVALLGVAYERGRRVLLRLGLASLSLVVSEALLGGLVVESDLRAVLILAHLGLATVLFGLLLILVLLSNLREMPRRWIEWARQASEEVPPAPTSVEPAAPAPFGRGGPIERSPEA
ncbi:MAG TPA: COX15/CtaA family protein [Thermoplasmata archaeon]|nr:COX15/CtaA family protein [Thermoplasmata archaeon]